MRSWEQTRKLGNFVTFENACTGVLREAPRRRYATAELWRINFGVRQSFAALRWSGPHERTLGYPESDQMSGQEANIITTGKVLLLYPPILKR